MSVVALGMVMALVAMAAGGKRIDGAFLRGPHRGGERFSVDDFCEHGIL